ncbi:Protein SERAC1 [Madurella mycetomatis]|uniref:Protein SERAC1 n=1 Tax=Madurella mycetomatis TaxID=100816 RepID=A0A175VZL3_9PEZI|nr:Protein SERAC1 [Madurella mycetomatis]
MSGTSATSSYGLSVLHSGSLPRLDIILVHGFGGHPEKTWKIIDPEPRIGDSSNGCWPRDLVPAHLEQTVRILSFRYYERTERPYQDTALSRISEKLLEKLCQYRDKGSIYRPIVWIGHSALIQARRYVSDASIRDIFCFTRGVIFFATPHHSPGSWETVVSKIFNRTPDNQSFGVTAADTTLLLDEDSQGLDQLRLDFNRIWQGRTHPSLVTFQESQEPRRVAPKEIVEYDHEDGQRAAWNDRKVAHQLDADADLGDQDAQTLHWIGIDKIRSTYKPPSPATEGTCAWIEGRDEFRNWQSCFKEKTNKNNMWIYGGFGWGKTYLSRHIIKLLEREPLGSNDTLACCSHEELKHGNQNPKSILLCLIYDIVSTHRKLLRPCLADYRQSRELEVCTWDFSRVVNLWHKVVDEAKERGYSLTLIIDGLDLCLDNASVEEQREFFKCITQKSTSMGEETSLRSLVLSRADHDLKKLQKDFHFIAYHIKEIDTIKDISATVIENMEWIAIQFKECYGSDKQLKSDVSKWIGTRTNGMYLWARLMLDELKSKRRYRRDLNELFENLPPGLLPLYDLILGRASHFRTQRSGQKPDFAQKVLFWITYQLDPMNEEELRTAYSLINADWFRNKLIDPVAIPRIDNKDTRRANNINLQRDISRSCGPLVKFRSDKRFVPTHHSVRDFLVTPTEKFNDVLDPETPPLSNHPDYHWEDVRADKIIRRLCTNYLLLPYFADSGAPYGDSADEKSVWEAKVVHRVRKHPFSRYAALNWIGHLKASMSDLITLRPDTFRKGSDERILLDLKSVKPGQEHALSWVEVWCYHNKWRDMERFTQNQLPVEIWQNQWIQRSQRDQGKNQK